MKVSQQCPKCESTRIWVIDKVAQPDVRYSNATVYMRVTSVAFEAEEVPFWSSRKEDSPDLLKIGTFEVWICSRCGFTEWYANDVNERLAELASRPGTGIQLVDKENRRGPFR